MGDQTFAAIIGGLCTLISSIVTIFIKKYIENRGLKSSSVRRQRALKGVWSGEINQTAFFEHKNKSYPIKIEINPHRKEVFGYASWSIDGFENKVDIKGHYYNERFLAVEYRNVDINKVHFGFLILELSADNESLRGEFLGYGSKSERLISGKMTLRKVI